jgi:hypothetical protein
MTTNEIKKVVSEANETMRWEVSGDEYTPFMLVGSAHDNVITYVAPDSPQYWEAMISNIECNLCECLLHPATKKFFADRGVRG